MKHKYQYLFLALNTEYFDKYFSISDIMIYLHNKYNIEIPNHVIRRNLLFLDKWNYVTRIYDNNDFGYLNNTYKSIEKIPLSMTHKLLISLRYNNIEKLKDKLKIKDRKIKLKELKNGKTSNFRK
jgi:hypothetical protein